MEGAYFFAEDTADISASLDKVSAGVKYDTTWTRIAGAIGLRAVAHYDKNDTQSALVDINNAIDKAARLIYRDGTTSTLDAMMLFRGRLFLKNEEYDRAEDDFRTVTRINLVPDGHAHMALLHFTRGRYDQAQEEIRIALKREPANALAFLVRGRISLEKGDYRLALQDCQQAAAIREANKQKPSPEMLACVEKARGALPAGTQPAESPQNSDKSE
jgi:tetratricopeptide (TPR) repeat protein